METNTYVDLFFNRFSQRSFLNFYHLILAAALQYFHTFEVLVTRAILDAKPKRCFICYMYFSFSFM